MTEVCEQYETADVHARMKNLETDKDTYAIFEARNDVFRYLASETNLWLGSFDQR